MRIVSVSTVVYDGRPLETALAQLAALGAEFVEPAFIHGYMDFDETAFSDAAARAWRAQLAAVGLSAPAISAHIDLGAPDARERLARRLRFAAGIGAGFVITNATARAHEAAARRCLEAALPIAEAARVAIALENPGHGAGALVPDYASGASFAASFASDRLRLNYDVANVLTYSEGALRPEDDFAKAGALVAHCHLKDVRATALGWTYTPLGEGDVALDRIAQRLAASGVPVAIELPLRLSRRRGGDPERLRPPLDLAEIGAAVQKSLEHWRRALRDAGERT